MVMSYVGLWVSYGDKGKVSSKYSQQGAYGTGQGARANASKQATACMSGLRSGYAGECRVQRRRSGSMLGGSGQGVSGCGRASGLRAVGAISYGCVCQGKHASLCQGGRRRAYEEYAWAVWLAGWPAGPPRARQGKGQGQGQGQMGQGLQQGSGRQPRTAMQYNTNLAQDVRVTTTVDGYGSDGASGA